MSPSTIFSGPCSPPFSCLEGSNTGVAGYLLQVTLPPILLRSYHKPPKQKAKEASKIASPTKVGNNNVIINRVAETPTTVFADIAEVIGPAAEARHGSTAHDAAAQEGNDTVEGASLRLAGPDRELVARAE